MTHEVIQQLSRREEMQLDDPNWISYFYYYRRESIGDFSADGANIGKGDICYVLHLASAYSADNPHSALREMSEELGWIARRVTAEEDLPRVHILGFAKPSYSKNHGKTLSF